jgi:hypothetical protein
MTKEPGRRVYQEDIDWVFFRAGAALTPEQVDAAVAGFRRDKTSFHDTVQQKSPPLNSPCNF